MNSVTRTLCLCAADGDSDGVRGHGGEHSGAGVRAGGGRPGSAGHDALRDRLGHPG